MGITKAGSTSGVEQSAATTDESSYEAVIGLEVHVQLATATKMFCRCQNRFGAEPNRLVCAVCLGYPGALPVPNKQAVDLAISLALAVGATVHRQSVFARKSYFYADLPKGYQISQFDRPLAEGGRVPLSRHQGAVNLERLHLEEDAGKLLHQLPGGQTLPGRSLADFNRCGVPLVEIVTLPEITSANEAQDFLQSLHQLLRYLGSSDANMEEGSLRCDANVSVRPRGTQTLGTKTEVKNLNSFRFVGRAIEYEIKRQIRVLQDGDRVRAETRTFDADTGHTRPMRSKEGAHDYRYFPEPDLGHLILTEKRVDTLAAALPARPWQRREHLRQTWGLNAEDALLLSSERELADYFEEAAEAFPKGAVAVANWVKTEVLRLLKQRREDLASAPPPTRIAALVREVDSGSLSSTGAKTVLEAIWESGEEPAAAAERLGLTQSSDPDELQSWARAAIEDNPKQVAAYLGGKQQLMGFFVGQAMRHSKGRADPQAVRATLSSLLEEQRGESQGERGGDSKDGSESSSR